MVKDPVFWQFTRGVLWDFDADQHSWIQQETLPKNTFWNIEEMILILWKGYFLSNMVMFGLYVTFQGAILVCKLVLEFKVPAIWAFGPLHAFHRHAKPFWTHLSSIPFISWALVRKFHFNNKIQATASFLSTFWLGKPKLLHKISKLWRNCPNLQWWQAAGASKSARCTPLATKKPRANAKIMASVDVGSTKSALQASKGPQLQKFGGSKP